MASIHRDPRFPKGVWYCAYTLADGSRAYRSTKKKDKVQAQLICQAFQQFENESASGDFNRERLDEIGNETLKRMGQSPIERITVKGWLEDWLANRNSISVDTRRRYAGIINEFFDYLGPKGIHRRLESITEVDIHGFIKQLRKSGRGPATINRIVGHLSIPFGKASELGKIRYNPVKVPDAENKDTIARETFTPEQVARLVGVAPRDWQGAILYAYGSGARLQDVANLRWSSLDLTYGVATFLERKNAHRKSAKPITIGLHENFVEWIENQKIASEAPDSFVFPSLSSDNVKHGTDLSAEFRCIMEKAGVKGRLLRERKEGKSRRFWSLSFHSFRHGAASAVFNEAALIEIARQVTGHAANGSIGRYVHKDIAVAKAATSLIPRLPRVVGP
jgi:integrase